MQRTRVGIVRGGPSNEYEVSLKTGKMVFDVLHDSLYEPVDIFIDREGTWHRGGVPIAPEKAIRDLDVVFNALHGAYGEDGKIQQLLDKWGVAYTGSGAVPSALGMNKGLAKKHFAKVGIKTPYFKLLTPTPQLEGELVTILRSLPLPLVVKPYNSGSSLGVSIAYSFSDLQKAVAYAFTYAATIVIEEYIAGREGTLGVVDQFRGQMHYPLLPIEIRPRGKTFFDYEAKYNGLSDEIIPGGFSKDEVGEIEKAVLMAHQSMGLRHYSRTDFIVHPRRGVFLLEVNTLPRLTEESLLPKSLKALGVSVEEFLHHIIELALRRK